MAPASRLAAADAGAAAAERRALGGAGGLVLAVAICGAAAVGAQQPAAAALDGAVRQRVVRDRVGDYQAQEGATAALPALLGARLALVKRRLASKRASPRPPGSGAHLLHWAGFQASGGK